MRSATIPGVAGLLALLITGLGQRAQRASDEVQLTTLGNDVIVNVPEGAALRAVLEECQEHLPTQLYFSYAQLDRIRVSADSFTVRRTRLWERLQPLLTAADVAWVPAGEAQAFLFPRHTARSGSVIGRTQFVPAGELLDYPERWSTLTALIITTAMPLRHLDARLAAAGVQQFFRNGLIERASVVADANAVIMTGSASIVLEVARMLEAMDEKAAAEERHFRVYAVEHRGAEEVAELIERFLIKRSRDPALLIRKPREVVLALPERSEIILHAGAGTIAVIDELVKRLDR